jgi:hypothetical protein
MLISKVERTGSRKFAHLTNPVLPVGMRQINFCPIEVIDHAS